MPKMSPPFGGEAKTKDRKPGLAVAIAIGKPKRSSDLASPAGFGAPPSKGLRRGMPPEEEDNADSDYAEESTDLDDSAEAGDVTLTLTREQAAVLTDVLGQLQEQMQGPDVSATDDDEGY
jgi:hypothetical protein